MRTIAPNIFVGTLSIPIYHQPHTVAISQVALEIKSVKSSYRDDYRDTLAFITEKCTDLLLQSNAPAVHYFDVDYSKDSQTLYQKFAFIQSVIDTDEFAAAIYKIVTDPVTRWVDALATKDVRQIRRHSHAQVKELLKGSNRVPLADEYAFKSAGLHTIPQQINAVRKIDSVDAPENRFVKHVLETLLQFCTDVHYAAAHQTKLYQESLLLMGKLESFLHHGFFTNISKPHTLKLNSPIYNVKRVIEKYCALG